jgi:outer membrane receptor protein involved in Fe transport
VINLITPNSMFGDRFNQLDLSVNKTTDIGWGRLRLAFDVYNALNSDSIQNVTTTYGATWLRPTTFLDPRLARVTVALSF